MGIALKGDFIGFWIDNIHSSELGIIRTSDGSRFNENLLPTIQDKTVQVPGGDGFYYFGSYYTQRPFNISIAFDNMSEAQFRKLKQVIGNKKMVKLVFDEAPYKYYSVKSTGSPTLKYICFDVEVESSGGADGESGGTAQDDANTQGATAETLTQGTVYQQAESTISTKRVYKGEGTLNFIAYDPFGYARATNLEDLILPNGNEISNKNEWVFEIDEAGGKYQYPLPDTEQKGSWSGDDTGEMSPFYNTGDLDCDYRIFCKGIPGSSVIVANFQIDEDTELSMLDTDIILQLDIPSDEENINYCFDSKTNCVYGWDEAGASKEIKTDTIYNQYLVAAKFGKLPVGAQTLWVLNVSEAPDIQAKFRYY